MNEGVVRPLELPDSPVLHLSAVLFLTNLSQYIILEGKTLLVKIFLFSLRSINRRSPSQMFFKSGIFAEIKRS